MGRRCRHDRSMLCDSDNGRKHDIIRKHVDDFTAYAKAHPELTFLVTRIGCGIAGWHDSEIAPLFKEASELDNVTLPEEFWNVLGL